MSDLLAREALAGIHGGLEILFADLEHCNSPKIHVLKRDDADLAAARYDVPRDQGDGYWEFLRLGPDIFAIVCDARYPEGVVVPVVGENLIEFHFRLSGGLKLSEGDDHFEAVQGSLLLWRQPRGHDITQRLSEDGQRETSVTIYCRPSFITRQFGTAIDGFEDDLIDFLRSDCDKIRVIKATLYPTLTKLILDFASVKERQGVHLVRSEALALQIVSEVFLNATLQKATCDHQGRLTDRDVDCLKAARDILRTNFTPPPTIDEIGRRVGLSATKLKCGFRQLYGRTVFEFGNDLRMDAAKELLRKSDSPISQVSTELGYEYQNSFTVAFRRKWGVLPKDYRRSPLSYERTARVA